MDSERRAPKLHVYAQPFSHGDAWLVGNRDSLIALRDAIADALEGPVHAGSVHAFATDGEGYTAIVLLEEDPEAWNRLLLPYAELSDERDEATHPFSEMARDLYKMLLGRGGDAT